ncbi:AAA family ATPase [Candidatus Woesearchaeota archaeon]|nr:MAG: AAA family ATPase [Candidatus Woesearchaeota archaeon]
MSTETNNEPNNLNFNIDLETLEQENELLRRSLAHLKSELEKYKNPPLLVAEVKKVVGDKAILKLSNNHSFLVNVSSAMQGKIEPGDSVLSEQKSLTILDKLEKVKHFETHNFVVIEKPTISWSNIGGMDKEKQEIKEVIELPLKKPELFKEVGITPPKGILLHGPPGCGKTMLAKAVANSTNTTFIEVVGSELVQKFIGEGAKLVKELFELARENSPAIIFIDEVDALGAERMDIGTSGEREVQRTFMQLLAEIDGFKPLGDVKIIAATNRLDILDSALLRPGRLDRLIEVGLPNETTRKEIFNIYLKNMNTKNINLSKLVQLTEGFSGAEIKAVCTEAGYFAIRNDRKEVRQRDFIEAITKVKQNEDEDKSYISMFG